MKGKRSRHREASQREACPCGDAAELSLKPGHAVCQLRAGAAAGENGNIPALGDGAKTGNVVGMTVGNENAAEIGGGQSQLLQGCCDAAAGDAGVQQHVGAVSAKEGSVSGGAAGQCM